jgi:putative spermidine/putrescine transport system substrate-binding protein
MCSTSHSCRSWLQYTLWRHLRSVVGLSPMMLILLVHSPGFAGAPAGELVVNSFGGSYEKAFRQAFAEPFMKEFNVRVIVQTATSLETVSKVRAQKGSPQVDVVFADVVPMAMLLNDDLVEILDPKTIPNIAKMYKGTVDPKFRWVSPHIGSIGIAYNTNLVKTPVTSWLDLWKPEFKGKVAIPDITLSWGPLYMTAIARTQGGSEYNIDPAFAKFKELKPNVLTFYTGPGALDALLNQNDVAVAIWASDRAYAAKAAGSPVEYADLKEGAIRNVAAMAVPKGAKSKALAEKFINFVISTERQTEFCTLMGYGPTNKEVKLPPETVKKVPYGEEQVNKLQWLDVEHAVAAWPNWIDRWNREITTK